MKCFYCIEVAKTQDHVVPVARGGSNSPKNKVPACMLCNSTKGTLDQKDFIMFMDFIRSLGLQSLKKISKSKRKVLKTRFLKKTGIRV